MTLTADWRDADTGKISEEDHYTKGFIDLLAAADRRALSGAEARRRRIRAAG